MAGCLLISYMMRLCTCMHIHICACTHMRACAHTGACARPTAAVTNLTHEPTYSVNVSAPANYFHKLGNMLARTFLVLLVCWWAYWLSNVRFRGQLLKRWQRRPPRGGRGQQWREKNLQAPDLADPSVLDLNSIQFIFLHMCSQPG